MKRVTFTLTSGEEIERDIAGPVGMRRFLAYVNRYIFETDGTIAGLTIVETDAAQVAEVADLIAEGN